MADLEAMFLEDDGAAEEEEEEVTAQSVLQQLTDGWRNEKLSPDLLPHKADYVQVMLEQVDQMEENIKCLGEGCDLRKELHSLELSRIRYLLRSYLRSRLNKIECYCLWLLKQKASKPDLLSEQEAHYLREYSINLANVIKIHLDKMPNYIGNFNTDQMEVKPELESHVCVRSNVDLAEGLVVKDDSGERDEEIFLAEGSQHILPYSTVMDLILQDTVQLI